MCDRYLIFSNSEHKQRVEKNCHITDSLFSFGGCVAVVTLASHKLVIVGKQCPKLSGVYI